MKREEAEQSEPYSDARNVLLMLDGLIALFIVISAQKILNTQFGKIAVIYGFIMISIITMLRIMKKV
jgi:hypothetical protein